MKFASDDCVFFQISYSTIKNFTSLANWNPPLYNNPIIKEMS